MRNQFSRYFIKTGKLDKKYCKLLVQLYDWKQKGDYEYTGDHSTFDVFVNYNTKNGQKGFIGIEVKYAENLNDKPAKDKARYHILSNVSQLFRPDSHNILTQRPIQQIWRDHILSIAHLKHKKENYSEGFFIYLFPKKNVECQLAVNLYIMQFKSYDPISKNHNEKETGFYIRYLDDFILKLRQLNNDNFIVA